MVRNVSAQHKQYCNIVLYKICYRRAMLCTCMKFNLVAKGEKFPTSTEKRRSDPRSMGTTGFLFVANSMSGFVMSGERTAPRLEFNRHEILGTCPLLGHAILNSWDMPAPWDMPFKILGTCPLLGQALRNSWVKPSNAQPCWLMFALSPLQMYDIPYRPCEVHICQAQSQCSII